MIKLLIADDEERIRNGLRELVDWDELGIEVAGCASNGSEALEMIRAAKPDIMICDIRMPVMDGLTLLRQIAEKKITIHTVILSGYDDFSYVRDALRYHVENYLLKPVDKEELVSTLLGITEKIEEERRNPKYANGFDSLRSNILNRLIGSQISQRELEDRFEFLQIRPPRPPFRVAMIMLIGLSGEQADRITSTLEGTIQKALDAGKTGLCFKSASGTLSIVFFSASAALEPARAQLEAFLAAVKQASGKDVLITAGRAVATVEDAALSQEDATALRDYVHLAVRNRVLVYEEMQKKAASTSQGLDLDTFEQLVRNRNKREAFAFIDSICADCAATGVNAKQIKNIFIELVAVCLRMARRQKIDIEPLLTRLLPFDQVLSGQACLSLPEWLKSLLDTLIADFTFIGRKGGSQTDTILDYIDQNFAKDLSLGVLSERFSLTPAYIGTLIKNETGEIFSAHVNRIRVEKAKSLLETTEHSASDISHQVGYYDSNYFYKIFKKYTGLYPSEYRKQG